MRLSHPRRLARLAAACLALSLTPLALAPSQGHAAPEQDSDRWIIQLENPRAAAAVQAASSRGGAKVTHRFSRTFPGMAVRMDAKRADSMRRLPGVKSVTRDNRVWAAGVQNDPPVGLDRIDQKTSRGSRSYTASRTGAGVRSYVVDSGINLGHTDFTGRIVNGPNFVKPGTAPSDCAGHGTHVAGIVGGTRHGVAKQTTLVPIKVLDCDGGGYESDTLAAMEWVVNDHAAGKPAVLNMSLTGAASPAFTQAVESVIADGVTVVAAAGNVADGEPPANACNFSPANVPHVLTVANASTNNYQAPTSNDGPCVDLFAPGTGITSAWIGSQSATAVDDGTSMAAPHVAGAAAMVLEARPTWTPAQVHDQIVKQSQPNVIINPSGQTPNRMLHTLSNVTPGVLERIGTPAVSGTARVGSRLTGTAGSWGTGSVSITHAWFRVNSNGTRTRITGATQPSYVVTSADRGHRLQYVATGSKPNYVSRANGSPMTAAVS
ncbi:S8 family serine peptidase [Luteococcus sp. OSA5]|uniref:S8 family peptidase n=1 Tax=Luteococcus sp. OSA5 TaxID=3401630 RepID=UPI003B433EFD